jgi:hypothetical protein
MMESGGIACHALGNELISVDIAAHVFFSFFFL